MNQSPNSNSVTAVIVIIFVALIAILPFTVEVKPRSADAQTPKSSVQAAPVAQKAAAGKTVEYTLKTSLNTGNPAMAFVGVGGSIEGQINPTLNAQTGDTLVINLINGDPVIHDLTVDGYNVTTGQIKDKDQKATFQFLVTKPGDFKYHCTVPGHDQIGMVGNIHVTGDALPAQPADNMQMASQTVAVVPTAAPAVADAVSVVRNPTDLPAPIGSRGPTTVRVDLTAQEVVGKLADGTTYHYFTFNGKVPGPMIRVRVGDTVEVHLKNDLGSQFPHSIDLHAVTGPGGGAVYTQTKPGEENSFTFQALNPGLYVYHCATPSVAHHIASGMYGLILVEPEGGLPPVSHEFYVMEGEIYTAQPFGTPGDLTFSMPDMLDEHPQYYILNGASMALTTDADALRAKVGDTVRIFFGVGGPNATSSFHVIGEIFDRVYSQASLTANPLTDVQTTTVAPGGAAMVEFKVDVPGRYILVDHALSRLERGLAGYLYVDGPDNPTVFTGPKLTAGSGH
jgi:nitrite reductase (NO-forming)